MMKRIAETVVGQVIAMTLCAAIFYAVDYHYAMMANRRFRRDE